MKIIERSKEIETLKELIASDRPEFLGVYGRRRVGKTFLIREFINSLKGVFLLSVTGQKNISLEKQIDSFFFEIEKQFDFPGEMKRPADWNGVFRFLNEILKERKEKKIIIFIDELPWFSSRKSQFLSSLEFAWNHYWAGNSKIKLIVCGSGASWMIKNLINATGGLHNRLTRQMYLKPFDFKETKSLARHLKIKLNDDELLKLYMVFGGVPYYWSLMMKGKSSSEIIENLYFNPDGELHAEFSRLFRSLFDHHEIYERIVSALSKNKGGMDRTELLKKCHLTSGGTANKYLDDLKYSGFIESFVPFGHKKKDTFYRLIDEFSLFHLHWNNNSSGLLSFWLNQQGTSKVNSWAGHAFENFCLKHRHKIAEAMKIQNLVIASYSWRYVPKAGARLDKGSQVDLIFERKDNCFHFFEIKFGVTPFSLDKKYAKELVEKVEIFRHKTGVSSQIFMTIISPKGVREGLWNDEVMDSSLSLRDLLK